MKIFHTEEQLREFEIFKPLIARINHFVAMLKISIQLLLNGWFDREAPLPNPYVNYHCNEGELGFQEMVIPVRFVLSPFFSRII